MNLSHLAICVLAALLFCGATESEALALTPETRTLKIVAVGDIMIGTAFPSESLLPPDDGRNSFARVASYLRGDIVFGNLEGALLDHGQSDKCGASSSGRCFAFRMPERYGQIIRDAGFNLLSIANNHANDFGPAGRAATTATLDRVGIQYAGQVEKPAALFMVNGVRYGFAAFAPNRDMMNINKIPEAQALVRKLAQQADVVIVSFHGGAEGSSHTHVPRRSELFLGENRGNVYEFAHRMIDAGADLVLGHGPHVTRAVELYQDRLIAYSLGNFNTYGMFNLSGALGLAPILSIEVDRTGRFLEAQVISTRQTKEDGLMLDPQQQVFREMARLTQSDFPETPLRFANGRIQRLEPLAGQERSQIREHEAQRQIREAQEQLPVQPQHAPMQRQTTFPRLPQR